MSRLGLVFRDSKAIGWGILGAFVLLLGTSGWLLASTAQIRFRRDIHRIGFNHNWELLQSLVRESGGVVDSLQQVVESSPDPTLDKPYIVVSIADRRLWYKHGDSTLFTTQVAVGTGKTLEHVGGRDVVKFDTPRGRLVVQSKDADPVWVPPEWHYVEIAHKKGLGVVHLTRGESIPTSDGGHITVDGNNVVKVLPDGREQPFEASEGHEIIAGGNVVIPPFGTNQRKYTGTLGPYRLDLGDGYGLHGTDNPASIGHAASHGCVRLHNEDIAYLYSIVPVGTPVYIY